MPWDRDEVTHSHPGPADQRQHRYTHGHSAATIASHAARTAADSAAYLMPILAPGMRLLDVGCGPGSVTLDLARLVCPGQVVGCDNAPDALDAARAAAVQRGDAETRFVVGDALDLPFDDGSFDVVHAHQVLHHVNDPVQALREMARVARVGGWVAAREADYGAMVWFPDLAGLREWRDLYQVVARANGAEPDAGRRMRSWATRAGLTRASFSTSVWTYADPERCRWWGESQAQRYSGDDFAQQATAAGASQADLDRIAAAWRTWSLSPEAWFALPHGEMLAQVG